MLEDDRLDGHLDQVRHRPQDGQPTERPDQARIAPPLGAALGHQDRPGPSDERAADQHGDQQGQPVPEADQDAGQVGRLRAAGLPGQERADADADQPVDRVPDRLPAGQPPDRDRHGRADRDDQRGREREQQLGDHEHEYRDARLDDSAYPAELAGQLLGEGR